jgi:hypothetical protein
MFEELLASLDEAGVRFVVVTTEPKPDGHPTGESWSGDFRAAEERMIDASLDATASQRLAWLEEALQFAARTGALPPR